MILIKKEKLDDELDDQRDNQCVDGDSFREYDREQTESLNL